MLGECPFSARESRGSSSGEQKARLEETRFDGYRLLARIEDGDVRLFTRNGHDWTEKLMPVATTVMALGVDRAFLDGEIVVLNDAGVPAARTASTGPNLLS